MTTPTKTKTKKQTATKPVPSKADVKPVSLLDVLLEHDEELENQGSIINSHSDWIEQNFAKIEDVDERINAIFWMSAIGVAVAITFAGIAIFRH